MNKWRDVFINEFEATDVTDVKVLPGAFDSYTDDELYNGIRSL